jgi:hypothetical protein
VNVVGSGNDITVYIDDDNNKPVLKNAAQTAFPNIKYYYVHMANEDIANWALPTGMTNGSGYQYCNPYSTNDAASNKITFKL